MEDATCAGVGARRLYEPAKLLALLTKRAGKKAPGKGPPKLPISAIRCLPALFQPRRTTEDERHVQELARAVRNVGVLDPLLVMYIGRYPYLIDGHHRLSAYQVAGVTTPVPVEYFQGTVEDAVLAAGRENSKAKLPMRHQERQDFAWKLTLLGSYSKRQTMEAAGVSDGQVAIMRRAMKALGSEAYECRSWWAAHQRWRGLDGGSEWTEEEQETWKKERAAKLADQIVKACGHKFTEDTGVAAMTLERLFGRRLGELVGELRACLGEEDGDEGEL